MGSALDGTRIVDLTSHLSGPFCTMLLADMGADVIKVERKGQGDDSRRMPPFVEGESAVFQQLNRNKRSIELDLKNDKDLDACLRLCDRADVVVENFRPGTASRIGLGYDTLSSRNPRLVYCSISGFGQTGPYHERGGFDLMAQAMSGLMSICGPSDGPPFRLPVPISDLCGGMYGALGILNALIARERTGRGQTVDTSLFEAALSLGVYEAAGFSTTGQPPAKLGQAHRGSAPYQVFRTEDGWMTVGAATQGLWGKLCDLLGAEELLADPRFVEVAGRVTHNTELAERLTPYFQARKTADWEELFNKAGIPVGPVRTFDQVFTDDHTLAREMYVGLDHPKSGRVHVLGTPVKLSDTPGGVRRPAPMLGEHTAEILADWNDDGQ